MKEKLKKVIPDLPDAPLQISTGKRIHRNINENRVHSLDIQQFFMKSGIDTTADVNWFANTPQIEVKRGKTRPVLKENVFAKLRLLSFGHLHSILIGAEASGVIVTGATEQEFKGTKTYNAAHTLGVGLKLGIF
jgi:hypothetical protein